MLATLFSASCYWQPVPIDSLLSYPDANATTFRDVMRANLSLSLDQDVALPPLVQLIDRCFCSASDLTLAEWERESAHQTLRDYEAAMKREMKADDVVEGIQDTGINSGPSTDGTAPSRPAHDGSEADVHPFEEPFSFRRLRNLVFPTSLASGKYRLVSPTATPPSPPSTTRPSATVASETPLPSTSSEVYTANASSLILTPYTPLIPTSTSIPPSVYVLPLLRTFYDLRPHGYDLTIDWEWS